MSQPKGIIGICGSGLIGRGWAILFASAGYQVNLYDVKEEQVSSAIEEMRSHLEKLEKNSALRGNLTAEQHMSLIKGVTSLEDCVKDAIHIQECIPERMDLKMELFQKLDNLVGPDTILASSTSTISPSKFSKDLIHKENCIVNHPINPPYYIRLVEIVPSPWTSQKAMTKTKSLMTEIGQAPVLFTKEIPGFGLNRIQLVILNECWNLVNNEHLSVSDVDTLMTEGLAPRYAWQGPLETCHLLADGMDQALQYYGPAFMAMSKSLKSTPSWAREDNKELIDQLNELVPVEDIQARRAWRDERLVALSKLKREFNKGENAKD